MEYSISLSEILVAVIVLIASALGFIIKEQKEKIQTINSQLSEKKYKLYNEIYSFFFDLINPEKKSKNYNDKDLPIRIINAKKDLLIYAPDPIVQKFIEWTRYLMNNEGDLKHAKIFLELYVLIRKDMGHPKTTINERDILKLIMTNDLEVELMAKQIGL
jgi:hypothetical protein